MSSAELKSLKTGLINSANVCGANAVSLANNSHNPTNKLNILKEAQKAIEHQKSNNMSHENVKAKSQHNHHNHHENVPDLNSTNNSCSHGSNATRSVNSTHSNKNKLLSTNNHSINLPNINTNTMNNLSNNNLESIKRKPRDKSNSHKMSRKFLHKINAHDLIQTASRRTTASMARKIKLGEFFLRAKQWKDVAEFEAKELEKAKIYRSLRQTSAWLFAMSIVVALLTICDLEIEHASIISMKGLHYTSLRVYFDRNDPFICTGYIFFQWKACSHIVLVKLSVNYTNTKKHTQAEKIEIYHYVEKHYNLWF